MLSQLDSVEEDEKEESAQEGFSHVLSKQGSDACLQLASFANAVQSVPFTPSQHNVISIINTQSLDELRGQVLDNHRLSAAVLSRQPVNEGIPSRAEASSLTRHLHYTESPRVQKRASIVQVERRIDDGASSNMQTDLAHHHSQGRVDFKNMRVLSKKEFDRLAGSLDATGAQSPHDRSTMMGMRKRDNHKRLHSGVGLVPERGSTSTSQRLGQSLDRSATVHPAGPRVGQGSGDLEP